MAYKREHVKERFRPKPGKLLDQVREVMRYHHYAIRTEQTYVKWISDYIRFNGTRHPREMGKPEIERFLSHLAVNRNVAPSTQNQALNAILFLYKHVIDMPLNDYIDATRSKKRKRLPTVLNQSEISRFFQHISGANELMSKLLYGAGLRLMECIRLRVQDLDLERSMIYVRAAKEGKDRTTLFPASIQAEMRSHLDKVKRLHDTDLSLGYGEVYLPDALARKYRHSAKEFRWQYVFPAKKLSKDPRSGTLRRHHVLESGLQKAVKAAVDRAVITKRVSCHTFRHSFATHLLEAPLKTG